MKAFGKGLIGLILLLMGIALVAGHSIVDYKWTHNPPETTEEIEKHYEPQMKNATTFALVGNIVALIGVAVFIYAFMKHEHES